MKTERTGFTLPSAHEGTNIKGFVYTPVVKANVKAIFVISHGMAEHKERYEEFCDFLAQNGYAVLIHDQLGHGESVNSDDELGFFGENDGWKNLVEDCYTVTNFARAEFEKRPVIFFGHSMGSFIARAYSRLYDKKDLKGVIYAGTSGTNPAAGVAIKLADAVAKSKGNMHRSELINTLAFGTYNRKYKPQRTAFDWLTTDNDIVDKYVADKYCGFLFTACGYRDLFSVLKYVSAKDWYKNVRKDLPIFLIAGDMDPVGEYGKGVKQVAEDLKKTGHTSVHTKLYKGMRHELLNEPDRQTVMNDILEWADAQIVKR